MKPHEAEWFIAEKITHSIIGAFYFVFNVLGFGFLERVYASALERMLLRRGHRVAREVRVPIHFEGEVIAYQQLDMIVDDTVVIELKATEMLHKDATRQLFNYLRATNLEVGLLLHFGREPKFYRIGCRNATKPHVVDRSDSIHRSDG
jgi:GxxExxY protein